MTAKLLWRGLSYHEGHPPANNCKPQALLEDKIERLSHSLSHGHWQCSGSCRHSGNHQCKDPQTVSYLPKVLQAESFQGEPTRRWVQSPSPTQLRQWVTFEDSPREDARAEEPPSPNLGWWQRRNMENHLNGPDQQSRPERGRPWMSACLQPSHPRVTMAGGEAPWACAKQ